MDELENILKENTRLYLEFSLGKFVLRDRSVNRISLVISMGETISEVLEDYKEKHRTMV